jgi:hypothetical protein
MINQQLVAQITKKHTINGQVNFNEVAKEIQAIQEIQARQAKLPAKRENSTQTMTLKRYEGSLLLSHANKKNPMNKRSYNALQRIIQNSRLPKLNNTIEYLAENIGKPKLSVAGMGKYTKIENEKQLQVIDLDYQITLTYKSYREAIHIKKGSKRDIIFFDIIDDEGNITKKKYFNAKKVSLVTLPKSMLGELDVSMDTISRETMIELLRMFLHLIYLSDITFVSKNMFDFVNAWGYSEAVEVISVKTHPAPNPVDLNNQVMHSEYAPKICNQYIKYIGGSNISLKALFGKDYDNEYLKREYKKNSCVFSQIIQCYGNSFNKDRHKKINLTYEYVWNIIFPNKQYDETSAMGASIEDCMRFFNHFKLNCVFLNINNEIINKIKHTSPTKDINPRTAFFIIHNKHCYLLNNNLAKLHQIVKKLNPTNSNSDNTSIPPEPSAYYAFKKFNNVDKYLITDVNQLLEINYSEHENISIRYSGNMHELVGHFIYKCKYQPNIYANDNNIISINFNVEKCCVNISATCDYDDAEQKINSLDYLQLFENFEQEMYEGLINKNTISNYSSSLEYALTTYFTKPQCGAFAEYDTKKINICGYDIGKAYCAALLDLDSIPVFSEFDEFIIYDNSPIDPNAFYFVINLGNENVILLPNKYNILTGYVIVNSSVNLNIQILYMCVPHKVVSNMSRSIIEKIYNSELKDEHKKFIPNKIIGILEKKQKSNQHSRLFCDYDEACHYVNEQPKHRKISIMGSNTCPDYYIAYRKSVASMISGFLPLKLCILQMHALRMQNLANEIISNGGIVYGIKTDCLFVNNKYNQTISTPKNIYDSIGKIRKTNDTLPTRIFQYYENENKMVIDDTEIIYNIINIDNEYDTDEIVDKLINNPSTIIKAILPGSGKTHILKALATKISVEKCLFILPTNELGAQLKKCGFNVFTAHTALGIAVGNNENVHCINFDNYSTILWDECYMFQLNILSKMKQIILQYPEINHYMAGDPLQNSPIEDCKLNISNIKEYYEKVINSMFPNCLTLKQSKRLTSKSDKKRIQNIYNQIWNESFSHESMMKLLTNEFKIIKKFNNCKGVGISYTKHTRNNLNKIIHERLDVPKKSVKINDIWYYPKLELRASKQLKLKNIRTYTNYIYTITNINDANFTLKCQMTGEKMVLKNKYIDTFFNLNYCRTGHAAQGATYASDITIYDIDCQYITREWIWTAITRATSLDNVYIYI